MRRPAAILAALGAVGALGACGNSSTGLGVNSRAVAGGTVAGMPLLATRNTSRIDSDDPATIAAAAALAQFPGQAATSRPQLVALASAGNWRAALVASELIGPPARGALLLSDGRTLGAPAAAALAHLQPRTIARVGSDAAPRAGAQLLSGANPPALAASVAAFAAQSRTAPVNRVMVVPQDQPRFAAPAAAWAAQSGDPILFTSRDSLPPESRDAIARLQQPRIYVLGPAAAIGPKVLTALNKLGTVKRIGSSDPTSGSIAFARFADGDFGWGIVNPGHGLVLIDGSGSPALAPAAAALSVGGNPGPAILLEGGGPVPAAVRQYLLDIQPGYTKDPVRGVYNHAWLIGTPQTSSLATQAELDGLLQIAPVQRK